MRNITELKVGDLIWFNTYKLQYIIQNWTEASKSMIWTLTGNYQDTHKFIKIEVYKNIKYLCFDKDLDSLSYYMIPISILVEKGFLTLEKPIQLKSGMWVWAKYNNTNEYLIKIYEIISINKIRADEWFTPTLESYSKYMSTFTEITKIATKEEIQFALTLEAKQRGFTENVKFKNIFSDSIYNSKDHILNYDIDYDTLWFNPGFVYSKGQWINIIEEEILIDN